MAHIGLDTTQYNRTPPQGSALPPGIYVMTTVRVQTKQTKDTSGAYVEVEFDISSPAQFSNRKFWDRFNIINKNPQAAQIGKEALADLGKAMGLGVISDDQDLLGKTVQGRLSVDKSDNPQYPEPQNRCRKYYPVGVDADAADKSAKGVAPTPQAASGKPNWNNAGAQPVQPADANVATAAAPWKR